MSLSRAQQLILDGIEISGGTYDIPSYQLGQQRSARILESKGLVTLTRLPGGAIRARRGAEPVEQANRRLAQERGETNA